MVDTILLAALVLASMWVGPFWLLMLLQPNEERTEKWMSGPWYVLGPLIAYLTIMLMNLSALADMMGDGTLSGFVEALAGILGTDSGAVLAWTHFVIGDIVTTRWIWKRSVDAGVNKTVTQAAVFFGVMLMPIGLAIHLVSMQLNNSDNTHS